MKTACDRCAKGSGCTLRYDGEQRAQCPILDAGDEPLRYHNSEGYSDPTAFFALRNVMKDSKKQQKQPKDTDKLKAADKPGPVAKPKAARKRRPRTQVIHYD